MDFPRWPIPHSLRFWLSSQDKMYMPKQKRQCKHLWYQGSWGQHGAHLRPTRPRWAPCWPHELCYLGRYTELFLIYTVIHTSQLIQLDMKYPLINIDFHESLVLSRIKWKHKIIMMRNWIRLPEIYSIWISIQSRKPAKRSKTNRLSRDTTEEVFRH